jgi:hypothetical protein
MRALVVGRERLLGRQKRQPLAPGQVPRRHHKEVPPIESRDLPHIESLRECDDAGVHDLQPQRRVRRKELSHSPVIMRSRLDHAQLIGGDRRAELRSKLGTPPPLWVSQQMTDLGHGQRRDD